MEKYLHAFSVVMIVFYFFLGFFSTILISFPSILCSYWTREMLFNCKLTLPYTPPLITQTRPSPCGQLKLTLSHF